MVARYLLTGVCLTIILSCSKLAFFLKECRSTALILDIAFANFLINEASLFSKTSCPTVTKAYASFSMLFTDKVMSDFAAKIPDSMQNHLLRIQASSYVLLYYYQQITQRASSLLDIQSLSREAWKDLQNDNIIYSESYN